MKLIVASLTINFHFTQVFAGQINLTHSWYSYNEYIFFSFVYYFKKLLKLKDLFWTVFKNNFYHFYRIPFSIKLRFYLLWMAEIFMRGWNCQDYERPRISGSIVESFLIRDFKQSSLWTYVTECRILKTKLGGSNNH